MHKSALYNFVRFAVAAIFVASTNLCVIECYALTPGSHGKGAAHCHGDQEKNSQHHSGSKSTPSDESICCTTSHTFIEASPLSLPTLKLIAFDIVGIPSLSHHAVPTTEILGRVRTGADPPSIFQSRIASFLISAPNAPPATYLS